MVRPNRPELKKAGNLRHAFSETTGQFFTVFDADFCPRPEFLLETIPYMMTDPNRAILQTPQYFRSTPEQTWVEQGTGAMLENYYRVMQVSREEWGVSMCAGSNAIYRRTALEPVGGTIPVAHSEDNYTGVYVVSAGWTIKYILLRPRLRQQPGHAHRLFQPKNALVLRQHFALLLPRVLDQRPHLPAEVLLRHRFLRLRHRCRSSFSNPPPYTCILLDPPGSTETIHSLLRRAHHAQRSRGHAHLAAHSLDDGRAVRRADCLVRVHPIYL